MVIPKERRSLTLSTLLITSRPRSSKTSTFHTGSPRSDVMAVEDETGPLPCDSSLVLVSTGSFRFRTVLREATASQPEAGELAHPASIPICLSLRELPLLAMLGASSWATNHHGELGLSSPL